jgi:hypothetical protein
MSFDKLLKNDYVRLAILAVIAYLVYRYFFVVRDSLNNDPQATIKEGWNPFHKVKCVNVAGQPYLCA